MMNLLPLFLRIANFTVIIFFSLILVTYTSLNNVNDIKQSETVTHNLHGDIEGTPVLSSAGNVKKTTFEVGNVLASLSDPIITDGKSGSNSRDSKTKAYSQRELNLSKIILIGTIDGKISAFSLDLPLGSGGPLLWQFDLGKPLLSQSISQLLHRDSSGRPFRIIPSLDGSLFRLDSGALHSLPVNADALLSNSYRLSDDAFVVGSRETQLTGIQLPAGRPLYRCTAAGCRSHEGRGTADGGDGVLTVRRVDSTVRAVRTSGSEDWHFQVSECELSFHSCGGGSGGPSSSGVPRFCGSEPPSGPAAAPRQQRHRGPSDPSAVSRGLRFEPSTGQVHRVDPQSRAVAWRHQLGSPISQAWELLPGPLGWVEPISLFTMQDSALQQQQQQQIYVGEYLDQYYVQLNQDLHHGDPASQHPHQAWRRPQPPLMVQFQPPHQPLPQLQQLPPHQRQEVALMEPAPRAEPGFYPATCVEHQGIEGHQTQRQIAHLPDQHQQHQHQHQHQHQQHMSAGEEHLLALMDLDDDEDGVVYQVINNYTGSLWHYWPQIMILSLLLSVLVHLFLVKVLHPIRYRHLTVDRASSLESNASSSGTLTNAPPAPLVQPDPQPLLGAASSSASMLCGGPAGPQFVSRYHTEFAHVRCLGRGGFGLVFEARHIIDDCSYAIKRVAVRNSERARARILREVKALAKLDHHGIVRYYQAWFECPPSGWQERLDVDLLGRERCPAPADGFGSDVSDAAGGAASSSDAAGGRSSTSRGRRWRRPLSESGVGGCRGFAEFEASDTAAEGAAAAVADAAAAAGDTEEATDSMDLRNLRRPPPPDDSSVEIVFEHSNLPAADASVSAAAAAVFSSTSSGSSAPSPSLSPESLADGGLRPPSTCLRQPEGKLYLYIQMQLCQKASLRDWLKANTQDREPALVRDLFAQICSAVAFVHSCNLIHRDLKSSNIFFAMDGSVKIGDFGLATALADEESESELASAAVTAGDTGKGVAAAAAGAATWRTSEIGTRLYMSPEQSAGLAYNEKVDIFSLGLIMFELCHPFTTEMERVTCMLKAKESQLPDRFRRDWPTESDLISRLLSRDPGARPSAAAILEEPLLAGELGHRQQVVGRSRTSSSQLLLMLQ